jgi:hypothetical protein
VRVPKTGTSLGLTELRIVNDFHANALAVPHLAAGELVKRDEHVLRLHDQALSVMRLKGTPILVGVIPIMEYRRGTFAVRYWPQQGRLDVWHGGRKVLTIERWGGKQLVRYEPPVGSGPRRGLSASSPRLLPLAKGRSRRVHAWSSPVRRTAAPTLVGCAP